MQFIRKFPTVKTPILKQTPNYAYHDSIYVFNIEEYALSTITERIIWCGFVHCAKFRVQKTIKLKNMIAYIFQNHIVCYNYNSFYQQEYNV